ncbi:hypothetical protein B0H11DRAFT_1939512 [Mycena galericulata]|nr:hypothetical protein B0H11DRAFT_1939512 [Mycena galericulata]
MENRARHPPAPAPPPPRSQTSARSSPRCSGSHPCFRFRLKRRWRPSRLRCCSRVGVGAVGIGVFGVTGERGRNGDSHAGVPAHERARLPRALCVHPWLEVGPEEGRRRGDAHAAQARVRRVRVRVAAGAGDGIRAQVGGRGTAGIGGHGGIRVGTGFGFAVLRLILFRLLFCEVAAASSRWAYAYAGADTATAAGWWWWWGEEKRSTGGRWYCLSGRQYPIPLLLPRGGTPARTSPARSAAAPAAGP